MDIRMLITSGGHLWTPVSFAALCALAVWCTWLAFRPAQPARKLRERLNGYLEQVDITEEGEMRRPLMARVFVPLALRILRTVGRMAPRRSMAATHEMLVQGGEPGGLTVLDFYGVRLLAAVGLGGGWLWAMSLRMPLTNAALGASIAGGVGFLLPVFWLRGRVNRRKREIMRALPNALDMLTIGVEAGLAFDSAMLRVIERWDNALTREFRRALVEMRVGTPRNEALERIAQRAGVADLGTFVAVLVQSTQLGVSIADVLQVQAAQIREKRRMRAEELARKAGIKMMFPLVFCIFPSMFIVILGPALPVIMDTFSHMGAG